jgi:transcription initiation factor TFIIIB Brf1 subunit/transcription initiation factor TFIIB
VIVLYNDLFEFESEENCDLAKFCPECKGEVIKRSYQKICSNCGIIIEEEMTQSSYSMFENEEYTFSQGKQYVYKGKVLESVGSLGSYIDFYDRRLYFTDIYNQPISLYNQVLFSKLKRKYSMFTKIKNHETDYRIMNILAEVVRIMNLSKDIRTDAAYYFRKIKSLNKNIKNNISLIAFCVFFAVRNKHHNAPVTIKEISSVFQEMGHRVVPRLILRDGVLYKKLLNPPKPHISEDYVERLIDSIINHPPLPERMEKKLSKWNLEEYRIKLFNQTCELLKSFSLIKRGGKNPFIFAGAAIYAADKILALKYQTKSILTQKFASEAMKIAEYSIRDHYVSVFKSILANYLTD